MNAKDAEIERLKQENWKLRNENEKLSQQVKILQQAALKSAYAVAKS